jgi:hypothetical protein
MKSAPPEQQLIGSRGPISAGQCVSPLARFLFCCIGTSPQLFILLARLAGRNLQSALAFSRDDDVAMPRAEFDLPDVASGDIDLLGCSGRACEAVACLTSRNVTAPIYANGGRCRIKIGLQHQHENEMGHARCHRPVHTHVWRITNLSQNQQFATHRQVRKRPPPNGLRPLVKPISCQALPYSLGTSSTRRFCARSSAVSLVFFVEQRKDQPAKSVVREKALRSRQLCPAGVRGSDASRSPQNTIRVRSKTARGGQFCGRPKATRRSCLCVAASHAQDQKQ